MVGVRCVCAVCVCIVCVDCVCALCVCIVCVVFGGALLGSLGGGLCLSSDAADSECGVALRCCCVIYK